MSLPVELKSIFRVKQKSYKMVLVLAMIEAWRETNQRHIPIDRITEKFLRYLQDREARNLKVDQPPQRMAARWKFMSATQAKSIMETPIEALSQILSKVDDGTALTFRNHIWELGEDALMELQRHANDELDSYHLQQHNPGFSLRDGLNQILSTYLTAKTEPFANHPLGGLVRRDIPEGMRAFPFISSHIRVQGSVGQGNWATIPWIALMDTRNTNTTQRGEYLVYLFAEDMSAVYLTFLQGVTEPIRERGRRDGYAYLERKVQQMREQLSLDGFNQDDRIELTSSGLGRDYQVSTVAYKRYDRGHLPEDEQLMADLERLMENYQQYVEAQLQGGLNENDQEEPVQEVEEVDTRSVSERLEDIKAYIRSKGFSYPDQLIENFYLSVKTKPFVILAGVSGTGKTKLVKLFAEAVGATANNGQFTLIPVRPDWNDPSDLLGYKDLSGVFRPGRLTEALCEASKSENKDKPFFICLDEMNLARVEHYFSDLLSVLETQEWRGERMVTAPIIHRSSLSTQEDQERYGDLSIPDNVYLIGTVNMDETTHPFSKKVLDRAHTIEFNYIDLAQFPEEVNGSTIRPLRVQNDFLRSEYLQLVDAYQESREIVTDVTQRLVQINAILEDIHAHIGFRIRDAVCFYTIYSEKFNLMTKDEAFDYQLLQKILPRIQGSSSSTKRALLKLMMGCLGTSFSLNEMMEDASPLYSEARLTEAAARAKYPRSARKIAFMLRRLEEDGFTSYWLS